MAAPAAAATAAGEIAGQPPVKRKGLSSGLIAVIVVCVGLCAVVCLSTSGGSSGSRESTHDAVGAWVIAEEFVKDRLKAPATAQFPCCYSDFVTYLGDGRYRIVSYVDAENSFGAKIRTHFVAEVSWAGNDKWHLDSIDFSD